MLILWRKGLIKMASSLLPFPPQTASTCRRLVLLCDGTAFEYFPRVGCVPENVKTKTAKTRRSVDNHGDLFIYIDMLNVSDHSNTVILSSISNRTSERKISLK